MTRVKKLALLFTYFSFSFLWGQTASQRQTLQEVFSVLETKYQCTFSYKGIDLQYHYLDVPKADNLNDLVANRQAQPGTHADPFGGEAGVEDILQVIL